MISYKRILVALDLSSKDDQVFRYLDYLMEFFNPEKIYFLHIISSFDNPGTETAEMYKLFAPEEPLDERIKNRIEQKVVNFLGKWHNVDLQTEVIEGKPYQQLMHWLQVKKIDLLVVGKKGESKGSGITARRVARSAEIPIYFVGDNASFPINKILVPIDFSENSAKAIDVALSFKQKKSDIVVELINVIIPTGITPETGISYATLKQMLVERSKQDYQKFINKHQFDHNKVTFQTLLNERLNIANNIRQYGKDASVDLIVNGAAGHSFLAGLLFGSVTESLVTYEAELPIMIVR